MTVKLFYVIPLRIFAVGFIDVEARERDVMTSLDDAPSPGWLS